MSVWRAKRWLRRHLLRHHGEVCDRCARPCAIGGTYWFAPNWLWNILEPRSAMRCPACFTADCEAAGIQIGWTCGPVGDVEAWVPEAASSTGSER